MPSSTFDNLPSEKREQFISHFLTEFSLRNFEAASISQVVKQLGIAKGSVYQYFDHKLALFLFLKSHCEAIKKSYLQNIDRSNFADFWLYMQHVFAQGAMFDVQHPTESGFLFAISKYENSVLLRPHLAGWKAQQLNFFSALIQQEIDAGYFHNKVPARLMARMLISTALNIADILQDDYGLNLDQNVAAGQPVFSQNLNHYQSIITASLLILKQGFQNDSTS